MCSLEQIKTSGAAEREPPGFRGPATTVRANADYGQIAGHEQVERADILVETPDRAAEQLPVVADPIHVRSPKKVLPSAIMWQIAAMA